MTDVVHRHAIGVTTGQGETLRNGRPSLPWSDVIYGATMKVYTTFSGRRAASL